MRGVCNISVSRCCLVLGCRGRRKLSAIPTYLACAEYGTQEAPPKLRFLGAASLVSLSSKLRPRNDDIIAEPHNSVPSRELRLVWEHQTMVKLQIEHRQTTHPDPSKPPLHSTPVSKTRKTHPSQWPSPLSPVYVPSPAIGTPNGRRTEPPARHPDGVPQTWAELTLLLDAPSGPHP